MSFRQLKIPNDALEIPGHGISAGARELVNDHHFGA